MVIDPCVLMEPSWLEEFLDDHGVADTDWTVEIPGPVIAVVEAMHATGRSDGDIASHFAAAAEWRLEHRARDAALDDDPLPVYPLGGRWRPTPAAVAQVLDARGRRIRRATTRPIAAQRRPQPDEQLGLLDLERTSA